MKRTFAFALIIVILDQFIKFLLERILSFGESITLIPNFFSITLLGNTGAAFSILQSNTIFLVCISVISICLIYWFFIKNKYITDRQSIIYGVLLGGILGNLIDRIFRGYVVDYLDFSILGYNAPIFNLADICIVISMVFLIFNVYKGEKNGSKSK